MAASDAAELVKDLRSAFQAGATKSLEWRLKQLEALVKMIVAHEDDITDAMSRDMCKPAYECFIGEIFPIKSACELAIKNLKSWMAPVKVSPILAVLPASAAIKPEPYGVVLIISAWNFPFLLALDPLVGAIAAGNAAVLKPSEIAPITSALISKLLPHYLDRSAIRVVEGGVDETRALLSQRWDKIFYTGSPRVARTIMAEAAKHLTPVVLELGGKCPAIVDANVDLKVATRRIAVGKWGSNNGQACVSPDYILVDASVASKFVATMKETLKEFYGEEPSKSPDLSRIVNAAHFRRVLSLLEEPEVADRIVCGGDKNEAKLYIAPTVLQDVPMDSKIMSEEIFGPLLPVQTIESVEQAIEIVNSRPKPLALYVFSKNKHFSDKVLAETSAGGVVVNDCALHFLTTSLPFGGVGESGMGSYHGKFSFDAFSHHKSILSRPFWGDIMARYPPYSLQKKSIVRCLLEADFLGMALAFLGYTRGR